MGLRFFIQHDCFDILQPHFASDLPTLDQQKYLKKFIDITQRDLDFFHIF
jgi:hypothetical protein